MEPNRLEREFKEKLDKREMQPSQMAWDRLDAMLSVAEKKKKPKNRTWLFVAASFLGFLLVGTLFLRQNEEPAMIKNENAVVEAPKPENQDKQNEAVPSQEKVEGAVQIITQPGGSSKTAVATVKPVNETQRNTVKQPDAIIKENLLTEQLVENNTDKPEIIKNPDEEANSLLADSFDKAPKKKSLVKVDPNSLLSGVEGELNESFRGKVWQTVTKNYTAVKTTVANRNKE